MATAATNDGNARARLTVDITSVTETTASWSASVTDNNPSFTGFGSSGAGWIVTIAGTQVANAQNRSYDFGSGNVASPFFPRSLSGTVTGLSPSTTYTASGSFTGAGVVGSASVSFTFTTAAAPLPPFFPPSFPFFPPFFPPSFIPAPAWAAGATDSRQGKELQLISISRSVTNATSYSITSGTLPTGLSISSSTGTISGTPSRNTRGAYNIEVTATGSGGSTAATFQLVISGADGVIQIYDTAGAQWKEGVANVYNSSTSTWVESTIYIYDSSTSSWVISKNMN